MSGSAALLASAAATFARAAASAITCVCASAACAAIGQADGTAQPASSAPAASAVPPAADAPAASAITVTVGGGFWSPRIRAVGHALRKCESAAGAAAAPVTERALFGALASVSLDGAALQLDVPASCTSSCVRPPWDGTDARGCAALAEIASISGSIWRVDVRKVPSVTVGIIADSELSFAAGDVQWHIGQGTDYPWSNHVGFTLSHRGPPSQGPEPATAEPQAVPAPATSERDSTVNPATAEPPATRARALDLTLLLPEWLDPSSVRVSARGRMLGVGDYSVAGRALTVGGLWDDGDRMHVSFPMPPRRVPSGGGVEIWRGPLRYVAEAVDQPGAEFADTTIAPDDGLRDVPYVLGATARSDANAMQGEPVTQRPTPEPDAAANAAPNGIMALMVERRARGLPDLVLVPLAFAGNRGDMPRVGTFAVPAP